MKVIVAGSRTITSYKEVCKAIEESKFPIDKIVSGNAEGVDQYGENYAIINYIDLVIFPANWKLHKNKAGILRNIEMGNYADALIAVWDGKSRGTKHMIDYMKSLNKPVFVLEVNKETSNV